MDLIRNQNNSNFVLDKSLWNNAIQGRSGYDNLLGFEDLQSQNKQEFIKSRTTAAANPDSAAQAEARWIGADEFKRKRKTEGRTNIQAVGDWVRLWYGHANRPVYESTNPWRNRTQADIWGVKTNIPNDYWLNKWLNELPPGYAQTGWIGRPSNVVVGPRPLPPPAPVGAAPLPVAAPGVIVPPPLPSPFRNTYR